MAATGSGEAPLPDGWAEEVKDFDETNAGLKGLVEAGLTDIPRMFLHPPAPTLPIIDLYGLDGDKRVEIIEEIRQASETWGFFKLVNHGVPITVMAEMINGVRGFFEQPKEIKMEFYTRDPRKNVRYHSNFDLYSTTAVKSKDSLYCTMAPDPFKPQELPDVCREITMEYWKHVTKLGNTVFVLLSEALGLQPSHLIDMDCAKGQQILCHYYPACPEPDHTLRQSKHSDPTFLTILLQDDVGGLQVLHQNQWVDVKPERGALVVNVGDLLQLISNGRFKSVDHRVLANGATPRASVAFFFTTDFRENTRLYGPIKELLSDESPPLYRETQIKDFLTHYHAKGHDGNSALDYLKL